MRNSLLVLLALSLSIAKAMAADDLSARVTRQAGEMVTAMKELDAERAANYVYSRAFVRLGVAPERVTALARKSFEDLKSLGGRFTKVDLGPPSDPFSSDGALYIYVPYTSVIELAGRKTVTKAFFIGASEDEGYTWKFIDGISLTAESVRNVIPSYSGKPPLPPSSRVTE